jgi:hypothetical protein
MPSPSVSRRPSPAGRSPAARRDLIAACVAGLVLFLGGASFSQNLEFANESVRFMQVHAIVEGGTLSIDMFRPGRNNDVSIHGGHLYPNKAPGQALLGVPFYWFAKHGLGIAPAHPLDNLSRYLARLGTSTLALGLLGFALFRTARRLGGAPGDAAAMVLAYGFGSIALIRAMLFGGHQLAAGLSFLAFAGIVAISRGGTSPAGHPSARAFGAGLAAGLAALSDYTAMFTALALSVFLLGRPVPARSKAAFLAGGLPCAVALAAYNAACFGGPFRMSYQFLTNPEFAEGAGRGLYGVAAPDPGALLAILFSPARGLFFIMPMFAFSLLGLRRMWRDGLRPEVTLIAVVAMGYLIINAGFYGWHGGWTFGPRYLTPMLPFLALPLAFAPLRTVSFLLLAGLSLFQVLPVAATINQIPEPVANPLVEIVIPLLREGLGAVSLGSALGLRGFWSLLPAIALPAAIGLVLLRMAGPVSRSVEPAALKVASFLVAVAVLAALSTVRTDPEHFVHCARAELLKRIQAAGAPGPGPDVLQREAGLCTAGRELGAGRTARP